ncbi:TrkH family potassium uptake protein [Marinobacter subterrani]|uniref:Trk-type K+ transport system, membrane component n=1 Tax=Marinobacter subterrani TaxID=1658765 RepID=A0A0J7J825_9GAMM|nr:potassium transporter TrkG [Marinobacter subterrani]KMQ74352.1 Trk-type K+ transport system, membrane component [Marinobacter subterrani]
MKAKFLDLIAHRTSDTGSNRERRINPPRLLLEAFLVLIGLGACLLKLPFATVEPVTWMEAAFTATSAITVTGLVVVDTGSQYTLFGQLVILTLIQLGGLGLMTFAVLTALALGFKLRLQHQLVAQEAFNEISLHTARKAGGSIALFALAAESIGIVLLSLFFVPELGWAEGLYQALFYTISAFNNAGFALSPDSLSAYVGHPGITLSVTALFITGGLGYIVVMEILDKRCWSRLSVYVKVILLTTLLLNLIATAAILILEFGNPATLGGLDSFGDKLLAAWFQGVTPRTAGFNTLDIGALTAGTSVLMLLLMFIGGAPNSTASGIKVSTFVILIAATRSFLRGHLKVSFFRRSLSSETVLKALATATIGMAVVFVGVLSLSILVEDEFLDIAFEVVSAFGTVGLSRGTTSELGTAGQLVIMAVMLVGRLGPLTLGYTLTVRRKSHVQYANTEFPVG